MTFDQEQKPSQKQADLDNSVRLMMGDGEPDEYGVDQAAVRPETAEPTDGEIVRQRTIQQMGIDAADRALREDAGLPPRVHNLT